MGFCRSVSGRSRIFAPVIIEIWFPGTNVRTPSPLNQQSSDKVILSFDWLSDHSNALLSMTLFSWLETFPIR